MDSTIISRFFLENWQRKALAVLGAIIIWLFVNHSITETVVLPNIPIRIINLPDDKTIVGLLPNRLLSKRVTLTLSGSKDVVAELEPGDLEVVLDVSAAESDEWVAKISKKNLISLNPSLDLSHNITSVQHPEFVLTLSPLVTTKLPIKILPPIGEAPSGYEFLDIWPQQLMQTVSGAKEEIQALQERGLELQINLSEIRKEDLDAMHQGASSEEFSYPIPEKWKRIILPCSKNTHEEINDPDSQNLHLDFLSKDTLLFGSEVPIRVFYPIKYSDRINPISHPLNISKPIVQHNGLTLLSIPLYVRDVSQHFLEIIKEKVEIVIVAAPKEEREFLEWSIEVINSRELEDAYVALNLAQTPYDSTSSKGREALFRKRFRTYLNKFVFFLNPVNKLHIESVLESDSIHAMTGV